jgi:hypothetical protein
LTVIELQIARRRGIFRVTCDGVFYGDYTRQAWARESAEKAADKLRAQGSTVDIVFRPGKPPIIQSASKIGSAIR